MVKKKTGDKEETAECTKKIVDVLLARATLNKTGDQYDQFLNCKQ